MCVIEEGKFMLLNILTPPWTQSLTESHCWASYLRFLNTFKMMNYCPLNVFCTTWGGLGGGGGGGKKPCFMEGHTCDLLVQLKGRLPKIVFGEGSCNLLSNMSGCWYETQRKETRPTLTKPFSSYYSHFHKTPSFWLYDPMGRSAKLFRNTDVLRTCYFYTRSSMCVECVIY